MPQYQVQDNALEKLKEILSRLKWSNRDFGQQRLPVTQRNEMQRASGLNGLFDNWSIGGGSPNIYSEAGGNPFAGMGTNNAAAQGGIYGQQPSPPIQQPQSLPSYDPSMDGPMNDSNMPRWQQKPQARGGYDTAAMDRLVEAIQGQGLREGPNENIQEDSRARALAQIARLYGG